MIPQEHKWNTSLKPLIIGFISSLLLTALAYFLAMHRTFSKSSLMSVILVLATIQALIQCIFFLHISAESQPRWNLITLIFTIIVMIIVVGGSLWIMYNLDYNMMPDM